MAKFKDKFDLYKILQETLIRDIVITGSTALKLYGLTSSSASNDLDLIIYDSEKHKDIDSKLDQLHLLNGVNKIYKDLKDNRGIGALYSFEFFNEEGFSIKVHLFRMTIEKRPRVSMRVDNHWLYLANPMNIVEAKQIMGRKKDYTDLAVICGNIIVSKFPEERRNNDEQDFSDTGLTAVKEAIKK